MSAEALARIDADLAHRVEAYLDSSVTAPTSRALITDLLAALIPEPPTDDEREAIEAIWDDGNAVGLDGWVGPGRGTAPGDGEAVRARAQAVDAYIARNRGRGTITGPTREQFTDAIDLRDFLSEQNDTGIAEGLVVHVCGVVWLAYCTDPDGEWFFESGDPQERMSEDAEGWREYARVGLDWLGPQVDVHGADVWIFAQAARDAEPAR